MPTVLTERETQVLTLAAAGLTSEQMSRRLNRSVWTVKSQIRAACRKLGARDRTHAVATAYQRGLLPMPPGSTPLVAIDRHLAARPAATSLRAVAR